jgi:hypothetical protein
MNPSELAASCTRITPKRTHLAAPLLMMVLLYWLSSVPGTALPDDPKLYALFYWVPPSLQNAAHVPAYAALAWAWHWALGAWIRSNRATVATVFILAAGFGFLDEWHQSFVPYRYGSLTDVALNTLGCAIGIYAFQWARNTTRIARPR